MSGALRLRRNLHLLFVCSLVLTLWLVILYLQQLLDQNDEQGTRRSTAEIARGGGGAELRGEPQTRRNSSEFLHVIAAQRRPLLVRFDWYSRKTTPVHIG